MQAIQAEWEIPFEPVYHAGGFDFPHMPVVTLREPGKVQAYQWGLIPHWTASLADAQKLRAQTLNARSETLFTKPSFRSYARDNRCLVLVDGFFEWMEHRKKKYPHYIHLRNHALFAFAGIYSHWVDKETGELFKTFSIITIDANPLMARIHNQKKRMPVILEKEQWQRWLQPGLLQDQVMEMLRPCDDSGMQARTISKLITTRGADTNVPEVMEEELYPELDFR